VPIGAVFSFPTPQKERASFAVSNMRALRMMLNGSEAGILNMASLTKPVKPAKKLVDRPRDATTCEQARSVVVNLNGLPPELLRGRIPPHWVDGIARLASHKVPKDVPAHRWRQFINDCHTFLMAKESWAERATGHGWNDLELFGCCPRPLERLANAGLLWAINGGRLVELRRDWAVVERASDRSRHVHQRERPKAANITLPWIGLR
jgi:hypothetical protein